MIENGKVVITGSGRTNAGKAFNDKFPTIPEYLTEIKQSEFLALQGK